MSSSSERLRLRTFLDCARFLKKGTLGVAVAVGAESDMAEVCFVIGWCV